MSIEKLWSAHAFNYIVLRVNPGLTSCEELDMALVMWLFTVGFLLSRGDEVI